MLRVLIIVAALSGSPTFVLEAQLVTAGAGVLLSDRSPQPVIELHAASAPVYRVRAYATFSWSDDSVKPVVITAGERSLFSAGPAAVGLGGGLLWLAPEEYRPYPILVSSTVVRLPIPRTSAVAIASTQPFQNFAWSVVLKASIMLRFWR